MSAASPHAESRPRGGITTSWFLPLALGSVFLAYQAVAAVAINGLAGQDPRLQWDGLRYLTLADRGYPTGGTPGVPPEGYDVYAFHPLYPLLVRAVGAIPGLSTAAVAPWLNLALATVALVVLARWAARTLGATAAVTLVVAVTAWPSSPVFQMAYTEGLALLLLVLTWQFVTDQRYAAAAASIVALSFARPLAVPLAATVAVVALLRWRETRSWASVRGLVGVVGAAGLATIAWPVYAGVHSGDPGVYLTAHNSFAKEGSPISPAAWALQEPIIAVLLVLVLVMTTIVGLKLMPPETPSLLRAWVVLYPPYLFAGSLITSSLLRYFMFAFPAALCLLPVARRRTPGILLLVAALVLGLAGAWWWVPEFMPPTPDGVFP